MFLLCVFGTGIGLCLSVWYVYFRDLNYLWTIIIQVYFFATPIIYDPSILDGKVAGLVEGILRWNPMAVFVTIVNISGVSVNITPVLRPS